MSGILDSSGLCDASLIDDRNERPLTIAIVVVWMLAFGLVSASSQIGAQTHHLAQSVPASIEKQ
jgi:hypothetical protein